MTEQVLRTYLQCGLRMRSEIELHLPLAPGEGADVEVRWGPDIHGSSEPPPGELIAAFGSGEDRWYTATATGSEYLVRFRDCGEFVISGDLSAVQVRRDPAGRVEMLPILMAGTVSALLLTLRGQTVLHASAVAVDGAAIAFVGQSGRGKSTLATLMCLDGADLVTDDVLTIAAGPPITCIGGAHELRLRPAASVLAEERPGHASRTTADERLAFSPSPAVVEPLPLAAIIVPTPNRTLSEIEVRCPRAQQGRVLASGLSPHLRLVPARRAQSRLHDAEPRRQLDPGLRRDDPVGTAVPHRPCRIARRTGACQRLTLGSLFEKVISCACS